MSKGIGATALIAVALATGSAAAAPSGGEITDQAQPTTNARTVVCTRYDGRPDDLLTGGLGAGGLASATRPPVDNPATAAQLRTRAIYENYRALIDTVPGGGYGTLYGPTVGNDGTPDFNNENGNDGRISGLECLTYAASSSPRGNVTLMVQVPDTFNRKKPCIVTGASSGSRGIYGAIGTSGEWGLKQGCAVAYTDKGTGTGAHDLEDNTVNLIDGVREDADVAGKASNFTAPISDTRRQAFNAETPDRFAFKHAHSARNPEADWGRNVLASVAFAFAVLNRDQIGRGRLFTPENTVVIASSVSNGAAAGLRALEQDEKGLIDGFAGTEPNLNPDLRAALAIQQGDGPLYRGAGKPLYDYYAIYNVYQGCANMAYPLGELLNLTPTELGENVCRSLREKGLLTSVAQQAEEAQAIINAYGILPEQNIIQPGNWAINVPQGIGVTYANSYARGRPQDRLCGYSFAATDAGGSPVPLAEEAEQALFATSNGIPPTGGVNLINDRSLGGPLLNRDSLSPSSHPPGLRDQNLDGALCQRSLWTGRNPVTGQRLVGPMQAMHERLRAGIRRILASGDLRGRPALIATGRADQVVAPNHAARAYFGLNRQAEGSGSKLAYIEVTNAQHLDTLNGNPQFGARYVPLHYYFVQVLNLMYAHLTAGSLLPPSQVIHTVPRGTGGPGGSVPEIRVGTNLPTIALDPPASARITFSRGVVHIPE